ncbi:MAG TPA: pyridoxal-phosphate dependent enzyme, partial [candidate division Zixibacteria bacterium]|nr:pyridoxal-phosphate dependent enzyme [candidate division Zixibacteria bacterium]
PFENAHTIASGLRVPAAVGDFMILDAIRESGGCAVAVSEERIPEWQRLGASLTGVSLCPETAACVGALQELLADGRIHPDEQVVIFNTGAAQKYPMPAASESAPRRLDITGPLDWSEIVSG